MTFSSTCPCPLCEGVGRFEFSQPDLYMKVHPTTEHAVYLCDACGVRFVESPDLDRLSDYYPADYYAPGREQGMLGRLAELRLRNRVRSATWRAQPGAVLDVGCGRGTFLAAMAKHGWQAAGMDWNAENAARVSATLGLRVVGGEHALDELESESFHVITLFHVLEHEADPRALLAKVRRLAAPGGRLLVAVPNGRSAGRAVFGRHWMGYDLPRHRYVFTPAVARSLLEDAGFKVERTANRFSDELLDLQGSLRLKLEAHGIKSGVAPAAGAVGGSPVIELADLLGVGSTIYLFAAKR